MYKAAGRFTATDLILDVTGYYLPAGDGLVFHALNPGRVMDTRTSLLSGLTGSFNHNVSRALDTDGHWGVPAGAKAVTGNLTVTGQTKGGFVAITPDPDPAPTTSTINFPLGDTRANGVTVPLNVSGNMSLIYRAGVRQDPPHPGRHGLLRVAAPTTALAQLVADLGQQGLLGGGAGGGASSMKAFEIRQTTKATITKTMTALTSGPSGSRPRSPDASCPSRA